MKNLILVMLAAVAADATPIGLLSGVTPGEGNNFGSNVLITPEPSWAVDPSARWVSFANTGVGGMVLPNTDLSTPSATFYQDFSLTGGTGIAGSIRVWADDTAVVRLDGVVLFSANPTLSATCAAGPIGCTQANNGTIFFSAPGLTHRLEFEVFQRGLLTFGLMYSGQVDAIVIPEPATVGITGIGFVACSLLWLKRRRATNTR